MKRPNLSCNVAIISLVALFVASCSTLTPGSDPVVVRAQQTIQQAKTTMNAFVTLEDQYSVQLKKINPSIHAAAENIRAHGQQWLTDGFSAIEAYRVSKDQTALNRALGVLAIAVADSQKYTSQASAQGIH